MVDDKAAIAGSQGPKSEALPLSKDDGGPNLENSSSASERRRPSDDDVENQHPIEPQQSNVSVWASESMSLPQEILFVATVCLTQFCNREKPIIPLSQTTKALNIPTPLPPPF